MRDSFDRYYTKHQALSPFLPWYSYYLGFYPSGSFCEPCIGSGAIATHLKNNSDLKLLWSNDFDDDAIADENRDASQPFLWEDMPTPDYMITNTPYGSLAAPIIQQGLNHVNVAVAVLVRLNFLERCKDRDLFPDPNIIIVLPRLKWDNTDYGTSDKVTHCWVIWDKRMRTQHFKTLSKRKLYPEHFPKKSLFGDTHPYTASV